MTRWHAYWSRGVLLLEIQELVETEHLLETAFKLKSFREAWAQESEDKYSQLVISEECIKIASTCEQVRSNFPNKLQVEVPYRQPHTLGPQTH